MVVPARAQQSEVTEYYHLDALGSVRAVTNQAGTTVRQHDYFAFGEEYLAAGSGDPLRFTGKAHDAETGLDYFGARYLVTGVGRFSSVDPDLGVNVALGDPQRWNRYSYVGNRPTRIVDPNGRGWASKLLKLAINGADIAATVADVYESGRTVLDSQASAGTRVWAGVQLASELLPVSIGDAKVARSVAAKGISKLDDLTRRMLPSGGPPQDHHLFPQTFRALFEKSGIDIDQFTVSLPQTLHLKGVHGAGLGNVPGRWNQRWQDFFADNPNATEKDIYQFAGQLMDEFGLSGLEIHKYKR
jgi:RHS repeat-associated protein